MAEFLGVSRTAIYMWPEDKPIPPLRQLQIENAKLEGKLSPSKSSSQQARP